MPLKTLFPVAAEKKVDHDDALRAENMKSLRSTRAAFRLIQAVQHRVLRVDEAAITRYVQVKENAAVVSELSSIVNDNARYDRLRQLGIPVVTNAACFWYFHHHPDKANKFVAPLRGDKMARWNDGKISVWRIDESMPCFLLWNTLVLLDKMTEDRSEEKLDEYRQLSLWDQAVAGDLSGKSMMSFVPRNDFAALDFSFVPSVRPFLRLR